MLEQPVEASEQEVPTPASWVDDGGVIETEAFDGGLEGPVEDKALDEVRGLQQGVALADVFGEVLVEVAEKASRCLAKAKGGRVGTWRAEETEELLGGVGAGREFPQK